MLLALRSLVEGASGDASAPGAILTLTASIAGGAATGDAAAGGATLTDTASITGGAATGAASASGATLTVTETLAGGGASITNPDATAPGADLTIAALLDAGAASNGGGAPALPAYWHRYQRDHAEDDKRRKRTVAEIVAEIEHELGVAETTPALRLASAKRAEKAARRLARFDELVAEAEYHRLLASVREARAAAERNRTAGAARRDAVIYRAAIVAAQAVEAAMIRDEDEAVAAVLMAAAF